MLLDDRRPGGSAALPFGAPRAGSKALMADVGGLNARYGWHAVFPAAMSIDRPWGQHAAHRSPRYTTRLGKLPVVRA